MSNSLQPHGQQHARLPCSLLSHGVHSDSCPLNRWCHPTILSSAAPSPLALNLSQHQSLSSELALWIRWPKYWRLSFSISPSIKYSGLISFRIDWFDLVAVQGILRFWKDYIPIYWLINPCIYRQLIYKKGAKNIHGERTISSIDGVGKTGPLSHTIPKT